MKKENFLFLFLFLISYHVVIGQSKFSVNISLGRTAGFGHFLPTEGYTPYFTSYPKHDLAYDLSLKYYFSERHRIDLGVAYYLRYVGVQILNPGNTGPGTLRNNQQFIDGKTLVPSLQFQYNLIKKEKTKFRLWVIGGLQVNRIVERYTVLGGFKGLELLSYLTKEGWYPVLNTGLAADWELGNHNIGIKLIGGLGFKHHNYYFYEGISEQQFFYGVNRDKGDYIGLLATWEYSLPRRFKKDKTKKSKKKKRK